MPSKKADEPGDRRSVSMSDERPLSMNGPLPMGACPNVPDPAIAAGTIDSVGDARADGNEEQGAGNEMCTSTGDGTDTPDTNDRRSAPAALGRPWATRSSENFTSSAVTAAPFEKAAPARMEKSHSFWSADAVHRSANPGSGASVFGSLTTNVEKSCWASCNCSVFL